jgi:hypothetical protein
MDKSKELYDIVLYSLEDKVKYLSKGLNLEQATEYMNNHKTIPHTMIGLLPHNDGEEDVRQPEEKRTVPFKIQGIHKKV